MWSADMTSISTISTINVSLDSNRTLVVTPTGQIETNNTAVINQLDVLTGAGTINLAVTVLGMISSESSNAINLISTPVAVGPSDIVVVGAGGLVSCNMNYASIEMGGSGNVVNNAGSVLGGGGLWGFDWTSGKITNSGSIIGVNYAAVHLEGGGGTTLVNTGVISGVAGIEVIASPGHVFNAGILIVNAGQILSTTQERAAIDGAQATTGFTLRNSGEILGPVTAFVGTGLADVITNSGKFGGVVDLGGGADRFFGKAGLLDSKISGGLGNDLIHSGRGDDVVDGGVGLDTVAGDLGDDSLTGGAGADTFLFQRHNGDDLVQDFQHGIDKLDLKAFHFANFAAVSALLHANGLGLSLDLTSVHGDSIDLAGLTLAQLTAGDVLL
jgi:Ca2+-binding RTX toxin-like protein